jgi:hypothetical protein
MSSSPASAVQTQMVTVVSNAGDGRPRTVPITPGVRLDRFLRLALGIADPALVHIRINGRTAAAACRLAGGELLCIVPARIEGAARVPTLKQFQRLLKRLGFAMLRRGPGDHEQWAREGIRVAVNRDSRDRKSVDIACVRSLARKLGVQFGVILKWAFDDDGGPTTSAFPVERT